MVVVGESPQVEAHDSTVTTRLPAAGVQTKTPEGNP